MILHLTLIKKWYDMTESGEKLEGYREIKPYWVDRLLEDAEPHSFSPWQEPGLYEELIKDLNNPLKNYDSLPYLLKDYKIKFKPFTTVKIRNGYGSKRPTFARQIDRISIGEGRPEWGAEPGKKYFIIHYKPLK